MPLVFELKEKNSIPLEVDTVRLEQVREQSADKVKRIAVQFGNKQVELGEFFQVSGTAAEDDSLHWRGDCDQVRLIGSRLSGGRIRVEGNAGMHLGAEMTGGEILVEGDAADWLGAEMHGGRIIVQGNARHLVGAVYRGARHGMTGGEILVHGDAGNEIGHSMRRGLIAVGGRTGDAAGFGMIAGTLLVGGEGGIRPGAGMRRGTIAYLSGRAPEMLPTFKFACRYCPVFLRIYLRHVASLGLTLPEGALERCYARYCGDLLELGRGEILVATDG